MFFTDKRRMPALLLALIVALLAIAPTALAYNADRPADLSNSDLEAASAILIDGNSGRVLYKKDAESIRYPASTTKIMTLLLALENVSDLDATITIPREANQYPDGSSLVGLYTGEQMTWRTLLTTFFICSGNDAGIAIAVLVAGSEDEFVDMMNRRALEIGCEDTNFANPHGFHDSDHYTTAYDLALIALEAMKNPTFREIASTTNYTIPANNKRSESTTKWTKNQFIARNDTSMKYKYFNGTGIKTGYTSKAGNTFVGSATKDNVDLISVVLLSSTEGKWIDSIRLMEYGFATYGSYDPVALYVQSPLSTNVTDFDPASSDGRVMLSIGVTADAQPLCATYDEIAQISANFQSMLSVAYTRELKAPINVGDVMGTLTYSAPDGSQHYYPLLASNPVAAMPAPQTTLPTIDELVQGETEQGSGAMLWIVPLLAVIAVLVLMIVINNIRARSRRRRRYARRSTYRPYGTNYSDDYRRRR